MALLRDLWRILNGTDPYLYPIPKKKRKATMLDRATSTASLGAGLKIPLIHSFIDNVLATTVTPVPGSVVYCGLALNTIEHSGIYVGNGKIVHLEGSGQVKIVTRKQFLDRLDGYNVAITVYVSSRDGKAVGSRAVATRAKAMVGKTLDYRLISNNCHRFSASCLGTDSITNITCSALKGVAEDRLDCDQWLAWTLPSSKRK